MAAQYPTAAGTDANLYVAANNLVTSLTDNPLTSGATTVNVASTTGFPTAGFITIDNEAIAYTGVTGTSFTTCTRGADGTTAASHTTATQVYHDVVAAHHNVLKDEVKAIEADLVACMAAITPVTAANTSTSALQRIAHIVSQIKNGFGLTNWYDVTGAMLAKAGGTMTGQLVLGGNLNAASNKIVTLANGTATDDAGAYGQISILQVQTAVSSTAVTVATETFTDITGLSVSITPKISTSKILIFGFVQWDASCTGSGQAVGPALQMVRDSTNIEQNYQLGGNNNGAAGTWHSPGCGTIFKSDAPGDTSAHAYKLQGASGRFGGSGSTTTFCSSSLGQGHSYIIAMEVR